MIKFRVWSERSKEFVYWGFIDDGYGESFVAPPFSISSVEDIKNSSEQCSGVKDKEGVYIYSGDIIEVAGNHRYIVQYSTEGEYDYELHYATFVLVRDGADAFPFDEYAIVHGKIIGNIHQNPELIRDSREEDFGSIKDYKKILDALSLGDLKC